MRKIRIAQIGTSKYSHGNGIFPVLCKLNEIFEVVGYALPENERTKFPKEVKIFEGYRELTVEQILSDETIEAVAIETEEIYLSKYALMAANAGKHIHLEKPGATSLADFEAVIDAMRKSKKIFHIGYMYRYNPAIIEAIERVRSGELGNIISVEAQMDCYHNAPVRKWLSTFKGGMMFFLGCHLVDIIYSIQGEPDEVVALNTCSKNGIDEGEDHGFALFKYNNTYSFAKTSALKVGGFISRQLVICGEKGTIEIKPIEQYTDTERSAMISKTRSISLEEATASGWNASGEERITDEYLRYDNMMTSFAEFIRKERRNPYTLDYELGLYKLILKACNA